jgi:hypothetical protein
MFSDSLILLCGFGFKSGKIAIFVLIDFLIFYTFIDIFVFKVLFSGFLLLI